MPSDSELLLRYACDRSEQAFAELVRTHIDLVYSAALRRVRGDSHAAMEITQEVFLAMALHAKNLARHPVLNAWLHASTRNAAANYRRREFRKERQKQEVHAMQELQSNAELPAGWDSVRGVLDDALDDLGEKDRQAIILRFFEGHSYPEISGILRLRDEAVRMRVGRALEKLRVLLERRGVSSTAAILGGALSTHSVIGAPAGFATTVSTSVIAASATISVTTPIAAALHFMSTAKLSVIVASVSVAVGISALGYRYATNSSHPAPVANVQPPNVSPTHDNSDASANNLSAIVSAHRSKDTSAVSAKTAEAEEKIAALRDVLARLPEQSIPELKLATNGDWHSAVDGNLETTEDYRQALGKIRNSAQNRFASALQPALRNFLQKNQDQFPKNTAELHPFVGPEIDGAMLQRYVVVPASEVPNVRMGGDQIITQNRQIDSDYDQIFVIGPNGFGTTTVSPAIQRDLALLKPAIKAYQKDHGEKHTGDIMQLAPYTSSPDEKAALERLAKKSKK